MKQTILNCQLVKTFGIVFLLIFLLWNNSFSQERYFIEGHFSNELNGDTIYIDIDDGKDFIQTTRVVLNNYFSISDTFYSKYAKVYLSFHKTSDWPTTSFFVSSTPAIIDCKETTITEHFFDKCKFNNAFFQEDEKRLNEYTKADLDDYMQYYQFFKKNTSLNKDSISQILKTKKIRHYLKCLKFIEDNSSSYFSFYYFKSFIARYEYLSADSLLVLYSNIFPDSFSLSFEGKDIKNYLLGKIGTEKGKTAPLFATKDISGNPISLKELRGKFVLINFWASWCVPCIKEFPVLKKLVEKYSSENLMVVSISLDSDSSAWINSVNKNNIKWINACDKRIVDQYGISFIPEVFLIDRIGNILYSKLQDNDADLQILESVLKSSLQ